MRQVSLHIPKGNSGCNEVLDFLLEDDIGMNQALIRVFLVKGIGDNVSSVCQSYFIGLGERFSDLDIAESSEPFAETYFYSEPEHLFLETKLLRIDAERLQLKTEDYQIDAEIKLHTLNGSSDFAVKENFLFEDVFSSENSFVAFDLNGSETKAGKKKKLKNWRLRCTQFWAKKLPEKIWSVKSGLADSYFEACFAGFEGLSRVFSFGRPSLGKARLVMGGDDGLINFSRLSRVVFRDDYLDSGIYFEMESGKWKLIGNLLQDSQNTKEFSFLSMKGETSYSKVTPLGSLKLSLFYNSLSGQQLYKKFDFKNSALSEQIDF